MTHSRLALGTMLFGTRVGAAEAFAILDRFVEHAGTARRLTALAEVAAGTGLTRGQVVLALLAGGTPPVRPIVGVSTVGQLDQALAAVEFPLPPELRARLDTVAP